MARYADVWLQFCSFFFLIVKLLELVLFGNSRLKRSSNCWPFFCLENTLEELEKLRSQQPHLLPVDNNNLEEILAIVQTVVG